MLAVHTQVQCFPIRHSWPTQRGRQKLVFSWSMKTDGAAENKQGDRKRWLWDLEHPASSWPHSVGNRGHHLAKVFQASRDTSRRGDTTGSIFFINSYGWPVTVLICQTCTGRRLMVSFNTGDRRCTPHSLKGEKSRSCLRYTMPLRSGALNLHQLHHFLQEALGHCPLALPWLRSSTAYATLSPQLLEGTDFKSCSNFSNH